LRDVDQRRLVVAALDEQLRGGDENLAQAVATALLLRRDNPLALAGPVDRVASQ
jgi:hypothetical protein